MKVRLLTTRASTAWVQREGEDYDLPDAEARQLIDAHEAEPIPESRDFGKHKPKR